MFQMSKAQCRFPFLNFENIPFLDYFFFSPTFCYYYCLFTFQNFKFLQRISDRILGQSTNQKVGRHGRDIFFFDWSIVRRTILFYLLFFEKMLDIFQNHFDDFSIACVWVSLFFEWRVTDHAYTVNIFVWMLRKFLVVFFYLYKVIQWNLTYHHSYI